jgi:hypothetical protein
VRSMTNSEKFLLAVLGLVILGGAVFFGDKALGEKQAALNLQRASLRADRAEAEVDLRQMPLWTQRANWIRTNEPLLGEEGDTRAEVLASITKSARDHKLEILEQSLGEVEHGPGGAKVNAEVKLKGSMEGLCRWLAELQKPASFYAVGLFSLQADQDQKSMVCTLRIARYFKESGQ